jgi:acyl dehydratase
MAFDFSVVGKTSAPVPFTYTWKDVALYALGVGAKRDTELEFLYEGRGPLVLPSFVVVPMGPPLFDALRTTGGDFAMVVHGGQRVQMLAPLLPEGTLMTTTCIRGIYDLKRFAIVVVDSEIATAEGMVVAKCSSNIIYRDAGGFGGETPPKDAAGPKIPRETEPTFRIEEAIPKEQALLYRLCGDTNPLHADPKLAAEVGFTQGPILHGLCTYGYMLRHAIAGGLGGDSTRVAGFSCAFRKPVWPGETLVTEGFETPEGLALRVSSKERNEAVLGTAWVTAKARSAA